MVKKHLLQLSFDVFNLGNLINNKWGRRYFVSNGSFEAIDFVGFEGESNKPLFSFTDRGEPWDISDSGVQSSRWSAQLGIRYTFGK